MSKWLKAIAVFLPLLLLVAGLTTLVLWSRQPERFPLRVVEVHADLKYVPEADIKATVLPFLADGFFGLDVQTVQGHLERMPWIETAEIRRVWPDRLIVSVREKVAQAKWGDKGILSTGGVVFYPDPSTVPLQVPQFEGPEGQVKEVLQQYLTMLELLGPIGLTVDELKLSAEGSWQMVLDNKLTLVLGKSALGEKMARFVLVYHGSLQPQIEKIAYIDLRYSNGFAIGWKKKVSTNRIRRIINAKEAREEFNCWIGHRNN